MRSTRRRAGDRPTACARAAARAHRSASTPSNWCAPGATVCFRWRGRIRACAYSKRGRKRRGRAQRATARLASGGVLECGAALLTGAPDNRGAARLATTTLNLRRLLLPSAVANHAATKILASIEAPPADHGAQFLPTDSDLPKIDA